MKSTETKLQGCFVLEPDKYGDSRGYFMESFNEKTFNDLTGTSTHFVQDNQSYSTRGVLRGLHAQAGDYAQAKLVRVLEGEVIDIAVDVRAGSSTFGQHVAVRLSADNNLQLFVPRGFLHGFVVLSETATFFYKCDNFYNKESECGVHPLDEDLAIDWKIPVEEMILSDKDKEAKGFKEVFGV
ncbi:dTDP-4-dehydrorhamnose 3,5-epimerase [Sphingobacterium spiritivorum]|uniref:dTDP-4-dehydrorhamnose 3,5-epimerase n=1 Tax=Sphingobacterium spiritivorum ATCC 33861 TaxID=525373 RepID=D7VI87_SPHSI|nr:dTDP-4-dehydrorhamnose 3,5-epimerase [Sphingobacterium spiritivorum]EFK59789.1 dTDP-4-dehydrorhamnose 3,5-epimerase [Sphingobacterium spiritivorum ATCC 33861]QQT37566.1 dTDP-4-dehydrorhamnose 3,5-epimerase [Sphingobacterium spiritivorum]WQD34363.1 dTDP-4-dehydrorhamnose 3,5-epimerase [Sphingobacterium spiritivorum]SUI97292.1 dTDP-4-dehydrorhamnose 3,5-epimerase [Sphingobacterium spiritivorum]